MDLISIISGLATTIINKVFPDKTEAQKQQFILELQASLATSEINKAQIAVNTEEAKSSNLFVSGWRPCVGWVCALSFSWTYFLQPIITYLVVVSGHPSPELPALDMTQIMSLLTGLLGMASLRTYEKVKGH